MDHSGEVTADAAAESVRAFPDNHMNPRIIVSGHHDEDSDEDEGSETEVHTYEKEQELLDSLQSPPHMRKFCEAWEEDTDIDAMISEGIGEVLPLSLRSENLSQNTRVIERVSKTLAEEIEAEELRRARKRRRHKRTLEALVHNPAESDTHIPSSILNGQINLAIAEDRILDTEQHQALIPRDWSSSEMLGIVQSEPKNISQVMGSEKRPNLILSRREVLPPFLPQRLLPPARCGKLPPPRINIPISDFNQDTSSIRNPSKHGVRVFKIPSRLYTSSGTVDGQLRIASWKNEVYAARDRGERHWEDLDHEYWGTQLSADEGVEEEKEEIPEVQVIIREVPEIVVSELAESVCPGKKRKRVADASRLKPPKAAPAKEKSTAKSRAESNEAKLLRQARSPLRN